MKSLIFVLNYLLKAPKELELIVAYQDYYGQDVKFECQHASFILENTDILNIKIPSADALTYRVYEEKMPARSEKIGTK